MLKPFAARARCRARGLPPLPAPRLFLRVDLDPADIGAAWCAALDAYLRDRLANKQQGSEVRTLEALYRPDRTDLDRTAAAMKCGA